jgi:hypothetical protein
MLRQVISPLLHIQKISGPIHGQETDFTEEFRGFPQILQANALIAVSLQIGFTFHNLYPAWNYINNAT